MKKFSLFLFVFSLSLVFSSCFEDQDDVLNPPSNLDVQNFVYRGMKQYYLYKSKDEVLDDNHFANSDKRNSYLSTFDTPEDLFQSLIYTDQDRFSVIVPDFHKLENQLNGITLNNGMEFGLVLISSTSKVFGYVRYVLPNTSAEDQGVERGMLFNRIDGSELNENNVFDLLKPDSYTIGLAELDDQNLTSLDQTITLTKTEYTEDPVYIHKTITQQNHKIGYLMYNGFTASFDDELNNTFGDFKAQGITDLVIDLRYNGGGSIETSSDLASMVTGQFNGQLFVTEVYNDNFEDQKRDFDNKVRSGATINSLNLNKVFIITTQSTASASELLISGLRPYINVVQVGETTIGKFQGSVTLYDSSDFSRSAVLPGHSYAMQPLVLKSVNADGFSDFINGLTPDIEQNEDFSNLGVLGNPDETLFHTAIQTIISGGRPALGRPTNNFKQIGESGMHNLSFQRMYLNSGQILKN